VASISLITGGANSIETLVERFIEPERQPVKDLENTKKDLQRRLAVFTDLKTKLGVLRDKAQDFTRIGSLSNLLTKTATSSNEKYFTVTATAEAGVSNYSIKIDRLAAADTGVSRQLARNEFDLAASSSGLQEFTIAIGDGEAVTISVTIDAADTNEVVMNKIRDAINDADLDVNASVMYDTSTTARLIIKSGETGSEDYLNLTEIGGTNILRELNYLASDGSRIQSSGTNGGFLVQNVVDLDAVLNVDGVDIIKTTNEIDDVLTGITIKLHQAQDAEDSELAFTVANDTENTKSEIEKFIEVYNEVIKYLNEKTRVDTVNFTRGDLAGDAVFSGLKFSLRGVLSSGITGLEDGDIQFLSQIGIKTARDGTLSISDTSKFEENLSDNLEQITNLFSSENGYGNLLTDLLNKFVKTGGAVDRSKKSINRRISSIDTRIKNYEARLRIREESLRRKFTELQKSLSLLNSQQAIIQNYLYSGFQTSGSYGGGSLF